MNKRKQDLHLRLVLILIYIQNSKPSPHLYRGASTCHSKKTVVQQLCNCGSIDAEATKQGRPPLSETHAYSSIYQLLLLFSRASVPIYGRENSTLRVYGTCATSPCTRCKNAALQAALRPSPSTSKRSGRHAVKARSSTRSYFPIEGVPSMISKAADQHTR